MWCSGTGGPGHGQGFVEEAQEAERLGFDSVWVAESWGNDAFTLAAWIAAHTSTIKLGTGVVQMAARTPTATAMAAVTLDHLSNGRLILGLGVSGPAGRRGLVRPAVEQAAGPHPRVRRDHPPGARAARARSSTTASSTRSPTAARAASGLGKPLKIMTHPLRADIPIFLGAEGPKNVAQTAEIADGWLPLYYSPYRQEVYADQLEGRQARLRDQRAWRNVTVTDDVAAGAAAGEGRCSASTSAAWAPRARTSTPS